MVVCDLKGFGEILTDEIISNFSTLRDETPPIQRMATYST
jgi:hypothetical protein